MKRAPSARDVAARVIARVEKDGAFASAALESELTETVQLDARDRALATELVYGSLRVMPWLLEQVTRFAPRGLKGIDARMRAHLAVAAYQLYFTRVPAFAAVSAAVESVREARGPRVAAFANAVLRRVAEHAASSDGPPIDSKGESAGVLPARRPIDSKGESAGVLPARRPIDSKGESAGVLPARRPETEQRERAVIASTPAWLREALDRSLSLEGALAFLRCGTEPPALGLRVERAGERERWLARLREAAPAATFEVGRLSPCAILARGAGKPQALPGWREGAWAVQEEGSQLAALSVGARDGETVLDACAGRGNKTAVLARAVGSNGAVDACDAAPAKLDRLRDELARLGLSPRATLAVDWTAGSGDVTATYDRVLVDAPCTGVGTLRRRPEIALRRDRTDLASMAQVQIAIASRAAQHVRPGGTLVYVVCSVLREEGEDVVGALLQAGAGLEPAAFDAAEARAVAGDHPSFRLLPHVHGTDGYFLACFRRRLVPPG